MNDPLAHAALRELPQDVMEDALRVWRREAHHSASSSAIQRELHAALRDKLKLQPKVGRASKQGEGQGARRARYKPRLQPQVEGEGGEGAG